MLNRVFNNNYEGLQPQEDSTINEQKESIQLEENLVELKQDPTITESPYSEVLQRLIGDGYTLAVLHADAIGDREIIGDDQNLRTEVIISYNIESSGLLWHILST